MPHTATNSLLSKLHPLFVNICKGDVIHLLGELVHHDQTILIPLLGPWEWSQEIKVQLLCYLALTLCCELLLHGPQVTCLPYYPIPKETLPQTGFGTLDPLVSK